MPRTAPTSSCAGCSRSGATSRGALGRTSYDVMHRLLAGAIIISVVACEDSTGPGVRGRLLGPASLAVEWSVDGTEIYHYSSGFSSTVPVFIPDQILATNAATGASRVVVGSCVWSIGATIRPTIMPPRATVAGLVYL